MRIIENNFWRKTALKNCPKNFPENTPKICTKIGIKISIKITDNFGEKTPKNMRKKYPVF